MNGLAGNDQITADPAAGALIHVVIDGGDDTDTTITNGTAGADTFSVTANGTLANVADRGGSYDTATENVQINGLAGNDTITAGNGLSTITDLTLDGGDDNDTIVGGDGADTILGGDGVDTVVRRSRQRHRVLGCGR